MSKESAYFPTSSQLTQVNAMRTLTLVTMFPGITNPFQKVRQLVGREKVLALIQQEVHFLVYIAEDFVLWDKSHHKNM